MLKALLAATVLGLFATTAHAQTATLTIDFSNLQPKGTVMMALYDEAADYDSDANPRYGQAEVVDGKAIITFTDLPEGEYGLKAFHDTDGDGRMSFNPFGMPTEPFAFSNNAVGNMGPATWDAAKFTVTAPATTQNIRF